MIIIQNCHLKCGCYGKIGTFEQFIIHKTNNFNCTDKNTFLALI